MELLVCLHFYYFNIIFTRPIFVAYVFCNINQSIGLICLLTILSRPVVGLYLYDFIIVMPNENGSKVCE